MVSSKCRELYLVSTCHSTKSCISICQFDLNFLTLAVHYKQSTKRVETDVYPLRMRFFLVQHIFAAVVFVIATAAEAGTAAVERSTE